MYVPMFRNMYRVISTIQLDIVVMLTRIDVLWSLNAGRGGGRFNLIPLFVLVSCVGRTVPWTIAKAPLVWRGFGNCISKQFIR